MAHASAHSDEPVPAPVAPLVPATPRPAPAAVESQAHRGTSPHLQMQSRVARWRCALQAIGATGSKDPHAAADLARPPAVSIPRATSLPTAGKDREYRPPTGRGNFLPSIARSP